MITPGSEDPPPGPGSMSSMKSPDPDDIHERNLDDPELTSDSESDSDSDSDSDSEMTSEHEDPGMTSDLDDTRITVLEAALLHVPSLGWTTAALEAGAKEMGMDEPLDDMFPR